jgi:hypothetical protein
MTLPSERVRAVINTRGFLFRLLDPHFTPRVPKFIRQEAGHLLRHYPSQYDAQRLQKRGEI